jgi:hypothetical protein
MTVSDATRFIAVFAIVFGSIACGAKTPTEPDAPAPVYELKTSTFAGTVKTGETVAFPFTVVNPGLISVSITELAPTSTITMGIGMGFWDAATSTCAQQLSTSSATLNVVFDATPSAPGEYCVGIIDVGNVQVSSDFTLKVTYY